eukprot:COSAG01_NODE_2536_length_7485_cov_13.683997_1_plen_50_part_00
MYSLLFIYQTLKIIQWVQPPQSKGRPRKRGRHPSARQQCHKLLEWVFLV